MKRIAYIAIMAATLAVFVSCGRPAAIQPMADLVAPSGTVLTDGPSETVGSPASDIAVLTAATQPLPWYAPRLERLGFYVFPSPQPLPNLRVVPLVGGSPVGVEAYAGKVVLLNFWATWCPPCRVEMPSIQALYESTRDVAFDIMAISVGERPADVKAFITENKYTFPIYLDETGAVASPLASRGIPTTYILDKQGMILAGIVGSRSYDGPEVKALIRELAERLP